MMNAEERLHAYEVDVQFPDVSGMEQIEMLYNRSELAQIETELSPEQQQRLASADQLLLHNARLFYSALQRVVNLKHWREQDDAPPSHWWWYLDVLAQTPEFADASEQPTPARQ